MCLIDGETTPPADSMCCSGDYGYVDGRGRLLYAGREDHQIKRWGHRVNLDAIQQVSGCDVYARVEGLKEGAQFVNSCITKISSVLASLFSYSWFLIQVWKERKVCLFKLHVCLIRVCFPKWMKYLLACCITAMRLAPALICCTPFLEIL